MGIQLLNTGQTKYSTVIGDGNNFISNPLGPDVNVVGIGNKDNDYLEISMENDSGNKVLVSTIHSYSTGAWVSHELKRKVLHSNSVNPTDLYAYVFFHGGFKNATYNSRLWQPRFTPDPFKIPPDDSSLRVDEPLVETHLGAYPGPNQSGRKSTKHTINFISESLYSWLGYNHGQRDDITSSNPIWVGDNLFGSKVVADCFLVQLLNLSVDAYDTLPDKQGRENILAVIPKTDDNIRVIYEANGLYFIDLNNAHPIKLSNIKLRIVRQDYSPISTSNLSTVVLFIK